MSMTLFLAYVRSSKRSAVERAFHQVGVAAWSESVVVGHGRAASGQGVEHLRIEAIVPTTMVSELYEAVTNAAETGTSGIIGDGLIVTAPLETVRKLGPSFGADLPKPRDGATAT